MLQEPYVVSSSKNPAISMKVTPGHFATSSSHISHYLDVSTLRTSALAAREVARSFAERFLTSIEVNTIICMENTEVIGAYLAEELLRDGLMVFNKGGEIRVMTPIHSVGGQLIFLPSARKYIEGRNVILLLASASSAKTASQALECLSYYRGQLVGILALFSAESSVLGHEIYSIFTDADIAGYYSARAEHCALCKAGHHLDAIVTNQGYTEL
jgi:orotate phosphoribosyltransferase